MNTIKFFRKPYLAIVFSLLIMTTSCSRYETETSEKQELTHKILSEAELKKASEMVNNLRKLYTKSSENARVALSPYEVYNDWIEEENIDVSLDPQLEQMMDLAYEENLNTLTSNNIITLTEAQAVNNFKNDLSIGTDFESAVLNFEQSINSLSLSSEKLQGYANFIEGLTIVNYMEPDYFANNTTQTSRLFGSCLSASIGVGIAFVGLATIEVGSFGAATGAAVAGFIWASAEWGAACGKRR